MALQNALGDIALDASVQQVKTSVDSVVSAINDGVQITGTVPLPDGAATQATLEAVRALTEQVNALAETLNIFMSQMLRMMPRKDATGREVVYLEAMASGLTLTYVSTVNALGGGPANNLSYSLSVPTTIYNNVKVS